MEKYIFILLIFSTITTLFGQVPIFQSPQPANLGSYGTQFTPNQANPNRQNQQLIYRHFQQQQQIQLQNQLLINQATRQGQQTQSRYCRRHCTFANPTYNSVAEAYNSLNHKFPTVTKKGASFYENTLQKFENMLTGKEPLNLKRAVYLVENSYYENTMPYKDFDETLQNIAGLIALKMKQDKMPNTTLAKNLAIYQ
jgi:hypothetical protein